MVSRSNWLLILNIFAALCIGAWIPLRLVFFEQSFAADISMELSVCVLFLINYFRPVSHALKRRDWQSLVDEPGLMILAIDITAALPLVGLFYIFNGKLVIFLFVLKFLLLRHLFSVREILDSIDNMNPVAARLIPLGFVVPVVVHMVSCGWTYLGSGTAEPSANKALTYIKSIYWAVATLATVGYGDISAKTPMQMLYASMTMIVGVGFFGYVLSNVASLLARLDAAREEHLAVLDKVEAFMRYNEVPSVLRLKVRSYYRYLWQSRKGYDSSDVLRRLPPKLRSEIALFMNKDVIEKVPLLAGAEQDLVLDVVLQLEPVILTPGERVFHAGEPGDAMYFIQNGTIEILGTDGHLIATLLPGAFFGETALLTSQPRNATARAATFCDLFLLRQETFHAVLARYPRFERTVKAAVVERSKNSA